MTKHKITTLIASFISLGALAKSLMHRAQIDVSEAVEHSALMSELAVQFTVFFAGFAALLLGYWGRRKARQTGEAFSPIFKFGIATGIIAAFCVLLF